MKLASLNKTVKILTLSLPLLANYSFASEIPGSNSEEPQEIHESIQFEQTSAAIHIQQGIRGSRGDVLLRRQAMQCTYPG